MTVGDAQSGTDVVMTYVDDGVAVDAIVGAAGYGIVTR